MSPPPSYDIRRLLAWFGAAAAALALGCQRDEVAHFRVPKESSPPTQPASMMAGGGAMGAGSSDILAGSTPPGPVLRWNLPRGWSDQVSGGLRYATLKPATQGKLDVTIVVLPGPAGGELANVNRWRNQIGLPPIEEATLASVRKRIATKAGPISVYDFESDGQAKTRVIAAMAVSEGNSWFVKMMGDAAPVAAARPEFVRVLESLRFEAPN